MDETDNQTPEKEIQTKRPSQNKRRTEARRKAFEEMRLNPGKTIPLPPPRRRRKRKKKSNVVSNIFARDNNVVPKQEVPVQVKEETFTDVSISPKTKGISCQESFLAFLKKWLDDKNISTAKTEDPEVILPKEKIEEMDDEEN
ncbi:uncharacterized protein LOC122499192 [Leptopilina heterotoma]|uniref:uncharacterized protein LOC122499192 n=1 Tax=Leptopilina heterotoma TaxID=63436 RepID=UPI001CA8D359|nr:uncharacterized protein LOC122499192 [Leptopilina heterotoma]